MRNDLDTEAVISAVNVDHSYQSLRVAQQRIQDEFMLDEQNSDEARVVSLAPDSRISRVKVGITEPDDQLLSAIGDLVDPGLVCWEIAESPTTTKK
ncbi:MAG: hypothetical protein KY462_16425 [Actinobacteria bacterium]|nr:hypothetical protein [Actinomycetota bacterium]